MKSKYLFFLLVIFSMTQSCQSEKNGYLNIEHLVKDFETIMQNNDEVALKEFTTKVLIGTDELAYLAKKEFQYEGLNNNPSDPDWPIYHFDKWKKFMAKLQKYAKGKEIKVQKTFLHEQEVLSDKLNITKKSVEVIFDTGELKHQFNFGVLLKIKGQWKKVDLK